VHCAGETEYSTLLQNSFAASAPYSVQPICTLCVNCSASRTRTHIFIAHPHTFYIEHILYRTCSTFSLHTLTYTVSFRGQFAGAHMYTHTHTNTCSHTHAHTQIHTHTHTHTHTHSLTHSLTHTYTHIHTHIHTHTHTHTHTPQQWKSGMHTCEMTPLHTHTYLLDRYWARPHQSMRRSNTSSIRPQRQGKRRCR